jgi:UDP-glucose 4-epimerase
VRGAADRAVLPGSDDNLKVNELLYRRADIEDVVTAHLLAMSRAPSLGFGRFIISATTAFARDDLRELRDDFSTAIGRLCENEDYRSSLARAAGAKGYHPETFVGGPYPVS